MSANHSAAVHTVQWIPRKSQPCGVSHSVEVLSRSLRCAILRSKVKTCKYCLKLMTMMMTLKDISSVYVFMIGKKLLAEQAEASIYGNNGN